MGLRPFYRDSTPGIRQLPSRNYLTRVAIPALVSEVKGAIDLKIGSGELNFFSGTTDLLTSTAGHPYLTFTCNFIDPHALLAEITLLSDTLHARGSHSC